MVGDILKRLARNGHKAAIAATKISAVPPPQLAHLMLWYGEIRGQAQRGQYFEPISFTEMRNYCEMFELDAGPFEFDLLLRLDRTWRRMQPKPGDKGPKSR